MFVLNSCKWYFNFSLTVIKQQSVPGVPSQHNILFFFVCEWKGKNAPFPLSHDIQHNDNLPNDTEHNDIQNNGTQCNYIQHSDTHRNYIQYKDIQHYENSS